ncbi:DNA-directed RNA polymerase III subunit RPC5 [Nakaseomyces bracarensis]|uniref:DNA-directed RNA polymerase III subunit RPC5 n=1 Tax=Nakaseomyces bracarensis TaxID=273131 RepID=A0ABR4NMC1_9SACH
MSDLFVREDDEDMMDVADKVKMEDDPIVKEIPLNLINKDFDLHLMQYVSKPKLQGKKHAEHPLVVTARHKQKSSLWELDIPLDESAFYNNNKNDVEWDQANIQTLRGVGVENTGQYAAISVDNQLYLTKLRDVAQMRPTFRYLDSIAQKKKQDESKTNITPANQKAQVVTMSVKSVNDQSQNRLTGSLLAHKVAEEEEYIEYDWTENTFDDFKNDVVEESQKNILEPTQNSESYFSSLI